MYVYYSERSKMARLQMNTMVSADLTVCKKPKRLQRFARLRILRAEVRVAAASAHTFASLAAARPRARSSQSQSLGDMELFCSAHIVDRKGREVAAPAANCKTDVVKVSSSICM